MYARTLDVRKIAARKSLFLFGPRSTGKTTLLRAQFDARAIVNLLRSSEFLPLAESPSWLREIVAEGAAAHPGSAYRDPDPAARTTSAPRRSKVRPVFSPTQSATLS